MRADVGAAFITPVVPDHLQLMALVHLHLTFSGLGGILSLWGQQEPCPFPTRLRVLKLATHHLARTELSPRPAHPDVHATLRSFSDVAEVMNATPRVIQKSVVRAWLAAHEQRTFE